MKYTPEYYIALAAKAYVEAAVDLGEFTNCPVVTWFDPMAIDDGHRIVCICQGATSDATSPGNFTVELEVGVRTDWSQPTVENDMATHFSRVNQVRDIFNAPQETLIASLAAQCAAGITVTYINQAREMQTEVNEGNYYSSLKLTIRCHATED